MNIAIQYLNDGIRFALSGGERSTFPLDRGAGGDFASWQRLDAAEQLWYDGLLVFNAEDGSYLLPTESYYLLDDEAKSALRFPPETAQLNVFESGNIGSRNYQIFWEVMIGGRPGGRISRVGNIVRCAGNEYALNQAQYQLVDWIDNHSGDASVQDRGQFHAKTMFLAKRAKASVDEFMAKREFLFADNADYGIHSATPQEISFSPILDGVPESLQEALPTHLNGSVRLVDGRKRSTIFVSKEAQNRFNEISELPTLRGTQVPAFLDNPAEFLPDSFEFDSEEFSKRVKGLKIRQSTAVPYVHVTEASDQPGWFDVDTGISLRGGDGEDDEIPVQTEELLNLMQEAADTGEQYVFYKDQWVKIPQDLLRSYREAEQQLMDSCGSRISDAQRNLVLDIYDNLNGVEYNEALLEYKNRDPKEMRFSAVPSYFNGSLYDYQQDGYGFMKAHYETSTGVLLADDMGLGKTVQIIAFLSHLFSINQLATALLVMPKSLVDNWKKEIGIFLPAERKVYVHQGPQRFKRVEMISCFDIVITTYETLSRDQTLLGRIPWSCVICDEAQKIKNFKTVAASAVKGMNTKCRIAVTGTPVENRLSELWSIADFAQPGLLGSYQNFWKTYEKPIASGQDYNGALTDSLIDKLSPIFLRRTKDVVLAGKLPQKSDIPVHLSMDTATDKLYREIVAAAKEAEEPGMMLAVIQQLIMLCSHPRLITGSGEYVTASADQLIKESPKLAWTVDKLSEIFAAGEKVILFTKYKKMQSMLRSVLWEKFGINAEIINGEVTGNRLSVIRRFSDQPGAGAIILSPKAAGVGLTITAANHVIHYTREWNPAVENQATDRAYRIGQRKPVSVYYPILGSEAFLSADEKLDQLLDSKRELMKRVIIPADLSIKIDDFADIFGDLGFVS